MKSPLWPDLQPRCPTTFRRIWSSSWAPTLRCCSCWMHQRGLDLREVKSFERSCSEIEHLAVTILGWIWRWLDMFFFLVSRAGWLYLCLTEDNYEATNGNETLNLLLLWPAKERCLPLQKSLKMLLQKSHGKDPATTQSRWFRQIWQSRSKWECSDWSSAFPNDSTDSLEGRAVWQAKGLAVDSQKHLLGLQVHPISCAVKAFFMPQEQSEYLTCFISFCYL